MVCIKCNINDARSKKAHYCEDCFILVRKETFKKYELNNKENRNKSSSEYKQKNKNKISDYNLKYRVDNHDILKEKRLIKRILNKDKLNQESIEWRKNNKEKVREYNRKHTPLYRKKYPWVQACRNIIRNTITRMETTKEDKTVNLLQYSPIDLKNHIESGFTEGMTWDNYGEWHIDHIRPIIDFPKETPISIINSLENLQPLWRIDNLKKGKKMIFESNI